MLMVEEADTEGYCNDSSVGTDYFRVIILKLNGCNFWIKKNIINFNFTLTKIMQYEKISNTL